MACPVCQSTEPVASQSPAITSTSHRLGIPLQRLPWASALSIDYNHAYDKLASFYAGNPAQPNDWREAIARAQAHPRQRTPLTAVLEAQQLARRAPEASRYACARLGD